MFFITLHGMVCISNTSLFLIFSFERLHAPSKPINFLFENDLMSKKYEIQKVSGPGGGLYIENLNDVWRSQ